MSADPVRQLATMPPERISLARAVVLDWLDGPTEGYVRMNGVDRTWYFRLAAERTRSDLPDDRLYLLCEAPPDAIDRVVEASGERPETPVPMWVPSWQFADRETERRAEAVLADLIGRTGPPRILLRSADLRRFEDVWLVTGWGTGRD